MTNTCSSVLVILVFAVLDMRVGVHVSHKFGGLDPTEKARIGATLIRCRVLAAKIATAWRGCNNARCYKTRLWNTRVTAGNADGARVSALCNKNRPLGKRRDCYSPPGRPRESCRRGVTLPL